MTKRIAIADVDGLTERLVELSDREERELSPAVTALLEAGDQEGLRAALGLPAYEPLGAVGAARSAHDQALDPHPSYLTKAEATKVYQPLDKAIKDVLEAARTGRLLTTELADKRYDAVGAAGLVMLGHLRDFNHAAGGGGGVWGAITGTLTDQADLVAALAAKEAVGVAAAGDAAHVAAGDPHPQYLTAAEGAAAFDALGAAGAAVAAHEGAANPHPTYLTQAEGDAAYDALGAAAAAQAASQPLDGDLTAIAGLGTTAFGRGLLTLADAAALTALLDLFTNALKGLVPASGGGTTNFLRADVAFQAPPGGGGGANVGTAEVNFGAFPGSSQCSVTVTGQAGIVAGSVVQAWIRPVASADHSADEHLVEPIKVVASDIVAATGFTIQAFNDNRQSEPLVAPGGLRWHVANATAGLNQGQQPAVGGSVGGRLPMPYGRFTVAWQWA